jgi:dolichyl-phosphate beta-glucosyltransferase
MLLESIGILAVTILLLVLFWPKQKYLQWREKHIRPAHAPISITLPSGNKLSLPEYLAKPSKTPEISLVVPSYNEEARLPAMLADVAAYFKTRGHSFEVIIANDGSKDSTTAVALAQAKTLNLPLLVVEYPKNRGKGGAVKAGMAVARGDYVLMVDADGATTFS